MSTFEREAPIARPLAAGPLEGSNALFEFLFLVFLALQVLLVSTLDASRLLPSMGTLPAQARNDEDYVFISLAPAARPEMPVPETALPPTRSAPADPAPTPILPEREAQQEPEEPDTAEEKPEQQHKDLWFVDTDRLRQSDKAPKNTDLIGEKDVAAVDKEGEVGAEGSDTSIEDDIPDSRPPLEATDAAPLREPVTLALLDSESAAGAQGGGQPRPLMPPRHESSVARPLEQRRAEHERALLPEHVSSSPQQRENDFGSRRLEPRPSPREVHLTKAPPSGGSTANAFAGTEPLLPSHIKPAQAVADDVSVQAPGAKGALTRSYPVFAELTGTGAKRREPERLRAAVGPRTIPGIRNHPLAPYLKHVRDRVVYSWYLNYIPDARIFVKLPERAIVISFNVQPAGRVTDVKVDDDGASSMLANALVRAIQDAAPLDTFEKHNIDEPFLPITFYFSFGP